METSRRLRVVLSAEITPGGGAGGVEQFVVGLVSALGRLDDGDEEYVVVGPGDDPDWLGPYLGPNQRLVPGAPPRRDPLAPARALAGALGPAGDLARALWRRGRRLSAGGPGASLVATSDGRYERQGADLVHFPLQGFVRCALPSVYNPHDLQHRHYPQFFTPHTREWRDATYGAGCRESRAVAVEAHWVRRDLARQYAVDPAKIYVIPMAPPTDLYGAVTDADLPEVRRRFRLPPAFALYPAQTWPHKNHLGLFRAVDLLRRAPEATLGLVCTGRRNDFWPRIEQEVDALGLAGQVRFLDFVAPGDLRALYRLAEFVVFPSLFEGGAFPVLEAFREGAPVACSRVTSLPEYAGDAALYFDPTSPESIAGAMRRLLGNPRLRETLRARGAARARSFTWELTARRYRALYRMVAGRALSDEDRSLLAHNPLCVTSPEPAPGLA